MSNVSDWKNCDLWKTLIARTDLHADECKTTLNRVMPKIQTVLAAGGTSAKDFTLHDEGHSFRVAQRMVVVAAQTLETLSSFELSLLLLSAYLHDIGMTPEFKKVDAHFTFILTGGSGLLNPQEIAGLQTWLDDNGYQLVVPIPDAVPLADKLPLAREITTHYCREMHNEWSGEWIRNNLTNEPLGSYSGWIEDLILLCQSHHFGLAKLIEQAFRPRRVAEPSTVVNLRFLALVLRISDILEFDPERTPDIILKHRDIAPGSQIYWWKDKEISLTIGSGRIVITARPSSARIHRAIEETADAIDAEMTLCRRIADDSPLGVIPGEPELPYKWTLPVTVHRDIEPRESKYEYIDGAFRPDTKKLLSLLSGTSLYQTPFHAVRELVQNAFDAVSERIAYQRFQQPNPASATLASKLASLHRVSLHLEVAGSDAYLVCNDNGIGMTKGIIRDRVLVSGSSPRHDVKTLDRRCKSAGFQLGRSGQFGIGILSYFMIATNVEIETVRSQEAPDSESTAWRFETGGIGSFGELRKLAGKPPGTQVRLRLTSEISKNLVEWYEALRLYLTQTLVYCPCEFQLSSPLPACQSLELKPGWCPRDYDASAFHGLEHNDDQDEAKIFHLVSSVEKERRLAAKRELDELKEEFTARLRWRIEEGELNNRSARYILHIPYFELIGGASLAFLRSEMNGENLLAIHAFLNGTYFFPKGTAEEAWKGMAVRSGARYYPRFIRGARRAVPGMFLRVNWVSDEAGPILASRDAFAESDNRARGWPEIEAHRERMIDQLLADSKDSKFAWLNERIAERSQARAGNFQWLMAPEEHEDAANNQPQVCWNKISFPSISRSSLGFSPRRHVGGSGKFTLEEVPLSVIPWSVPAQNSLSELNAIGWNSPLMPPDRVAQFDVGWRFGMAPIWLSAPTILTQRPRLESKFPPQWSELYGAYFRWYAGHDQGAIVWNCDNSLVRRTTTQAWNWCKETFRESIDPVPHRKELLADASIAASWLLQCISVDSSKIWEGLPERDPEFLSELLGILLPEVSASERWRALFWIENPAGNRLRVITPGLWTVYEDIEFEDARQYLPTPTPDWIIEQKIRSGFIEGDERGS